MALINLKEKNFFKKIKNKVKNLYYKKIVMNKKKFNMKETLLFMIITFAFGLLLGGIIMYSHGMLGSNSYLYEFATTYDEILNSYYEDVDKEKLLEAGISGMIRYLGDPYSIFMTKESAEAFNDDISGVYHGVGAEVMYDANKDKVMIGEVFENSPASIAGLQKDDILLKVDGTEVSGKTVLEIANLVKGDDNTEVILTVLREDKEYDIKIVRGTVDNISVTSEVIEKEDKKIGYINISIFANNTIEQFKKELLNVEKEQIDSLIIDVRSNSGGYLTTVSDIVSLFTKKDEVIYQLKTKDKIDIIKDSTDEHREYPIVVLTNSGSASASELLTGALQETYHATVIGTTTFGKGKVQKVYTLSNGSMIKYTYQEWLTPNGNYIDGKGITPDIEEIYVYNEKGGDNQLDKAIEVLLKK